jgi:hypothetical protein
MADVKISDLPAAGSANTAMELETNDSGTSRKVTVSQIMALVSAAIAAYVAAQDVEVLKGAIDCSANPNFPAADAGHVYRVSVAGKIGGASGVVVEAGDRLECFVDGSAAGTQAAVGANWLITQANIVGLGTAAFAAIGVAAGNVIALDGSGKIPALDASQLTNLPGGGSFASITNANSPYAAIASRVVQCTSGTITVNLPASPSAGDTVVVMRDGAGTVTVGRNTKTISGVAADFVIDVANRVATFTYSGTTWIVAGGRVA